MSLSINHALWCPLIPYVTERTTVHRSFEAHLPSVKSIGLMMAKIIEGQTDRDRTFLKALWMYYFFFNYSSTYKCYQ